MTTQPYDLIIGLDRSDKKADLCLLDTRTGQRRAVVIDTAPEALREWLAELRQQAPQARVGLCLEQPASHLIPFLEAYAWLTLHPINPLTLQKYREAFVTSRANGGAAKQERVSGREFVRRFLQHVLPKGFQRVRHYGWLGAAAKAKRERIHALLDWRAPAPKLTPASASSPKCPCCGKPMALIGTLARSPPG